ncbi:rRNA maturation RNase YbeY [Cytobacillus sp. S13-E01]|uniref:rRNA maturation RNase YbeY n=1 Tax=Cytobacillus sp. S13-E01 TaxID=3031326 RepID=UPI0023D7ECDD|nr:rRNA maturation RNase YbeY [Cytobacillus sp. S13-E01]MDF0727214.1 rRNA maturation RNase YbeY [Cytobacillus sp. S13-E01]
MILEIDFSDETNEVTEEQIKTLQGLLDVAAISEGVQNGTELSVTFVDNERIQEINRDYRDKDRSTDVISFALEEIGEGEIEILGGDMPRVLGDIIISIPKTKEQAKEYGHSFTRELGFLTVHGFLHLIGYDHEEEADEVIMFSKQRDILEAYGLKR